MKSNLKDRFLSLSAGTRNFPFISSLIKLYSNVIMGNKNEDISRASKGTVTDLPVVILQDEMSASGSELFAAALQANNRAIVIGATSFGKGTVNTVKKLSNGGAMYISTARYLSPTGQVIEKLGVEPDIKANVTIDDMSNRKDTVIINAVEYIKSIL